MGVFVGLGAGVPAWVGGGVVVQYAQQLPSSCQRILGGHRASLSVVACPRPHAKDASKLYTIPGPWVSVCRRPGEEKRPQTIGRC